MPRITRIFIFIRTIRLFALFAFENVSTKPDKNHAPYQEDCRSQPEFCHEGSKLSSGASRPQLQHGQRIDAFTVIGAPGKVFFDELLARLEVEPLVQATLWSEQDLT